MNRLRFCLNDRWVELDAVPPTRTLLRWLRDDAHLTGTKEGCAEGDCGACTVAVVEEKPNGEKTFRAINSCLLLLPMLQGKRVYTVEALKRSGEYHLVQRALAENLGSQCGYCTPGIVMALFEACYRTDLDAPWKIDAQMCGNLCRCTGYRPIREAANQVAGARPDDAFSKVLAQQDGADARAEMKLAYATAAQRYFNPSDFDELWNVLDRNPDARLVVGGTDLSLEVTKKFAELPALVSLEAIRELRGIRAVEGGHRIGATTCLTDLEDWASAHHPPLERMLRYFGARAIKNRATVGGNLCNASPIGDLPPVLIALGAQALLKSRSGERRIPLEDFFVGYRRTALHAKEILAGVEVPLIPENARVAAYKVSKRRELDISAVSAGMWITLGSDGRVTGARIAYGGMAATPARARKTEAALIGQSWSEESVKRAADWLRADFTPISDHRGSATYRALVARNLLLGFFEETQRERVPRLKHLQTGTVEVR